MENEKCRNRKITNVWLMPEEFSNEIFKENKIMKDLNCPYCESGLDVNHDDGAGYEENVLHEMECDKCGKRFVYETSIIYYYEPKQADCLNGDEHDYQLEKTYPKCYSKMRCTMCDDERDLTDEERLEYGIETVNEYINSLKANV